MSAASRERIVTVVDPELRDLVPGYLQNRARDAEQILAALALADYESIRISGHSMKGSGGGYGFEPISSFGEQIEEAAKNADAAAIRAVVGQLHDYLAQLVVRYG